MLNVAGCKPVSLWLAFYHRLSGALMELHKALSDPFKLDAPRTPSARYFSIRGV